MRVETIGDDGLPLVRYGFVGGLVGDEGPVVVMLDGDLKDDTVVDRSEIAPVTITTVELRLQGTDLLDDPALRQGLVNLWSAEAEEAGLAIGTLDLHRRRCSRLARGLRARRVVRRRRAVRAAGHPRVERLRVRPRPRRPPPLKSPNCLLR